MSTGPRFRLAATLPGGHRLFHDARRPGSLAIADNSGRTPDRTDDGVLHVNQHAPIRVGKGREVTVPLLDEAGNATRTIGSAADAFVLAGITGQEIQTADGTLYRVAQVTP